MGYWNNVSFVRGPKLEEVEQALVEVFFDEGRVRVPASTVGIEARRHSMQYRRAAANPLWGVAVVRGRPGWTIIRTAPLDLLMERAVKSDRMRLGHLASRLGAPMLAHNVYDSTQGVLVEANEKGAVTRSGFADLGTDVLRYYDEPAITEATCQAFFQLLKPLELFADSPSGYEMDVLALLSSNPYPSHSPVRSEDLSQALANLTGDPGDNLINVRDLIEATPLSVPGVSLYFGAAV